MTHSEAGALQNEPAPGTEATKVGQEGTSLLSQFFDLVPALHYFGCHV